MAQPCPGPTDLGFGPAISSCHRAFDFTLLFEDAPGEADRDDAHATVTYAALVVACCASIAASPRLPGTSLPAAALSLLAALLLAALSSLEHARALAPSPALVFFLALTALLDVARLRTFYLLDRTFSAGALTAGLALRLLLLVLECRGKRTAAAAASPEELADPISRTMFGWINPLLIMGFRGSIRGRLGPIDPKLSSTSLTERFAAVPHKIRFVLSPAGLSKGGLSALTLACVGYDLLYVVIPRLCVSLFTFLQPFLLDAVLSWLTKAERDSTSHGYGLIGATFFVYFGIAASYSWYWHHVNRSVTMIRGGLVVLLYDKLLLLPESPAVEARAMTLMFSDTQRVMTAMNYFHELWAGAIDTCVATWLLYRKTGPASLVMLAITIGSSIVCVSLSKKISLLQQKWLVAVEQRLARTKRMLSSLKAIKMLSAGDRVSAAVTALRQAELDISWPFRRMRILTTAISYCSMTLSPPLVFGVYVATSRDEHLDVSKLFTSLTLIALLASPVMHLCQAIPALGAAHGCMERIQTFLELEEQHDKRTTLPPSTDTGEKVVLSLRAVSLGWLAGKPILHNINLDVKRASRVAILGRTGAGKSLLLKGLLGEVAEISGEVALGPGVSLAYCSQTPWLENASAEENWAGRCSEPRGQGFLDRMAREFALKDIQALQDYKTGTIGSQGVKLSGGQRQRLALARAAALERDILLLDDVFSALDRRTKLHVAHGLLGAHGGENQRTVIFTTHDEYIASMADEIYEIGDSGILTRRPKTERPPEELISADAVSPAETKEEAPTSGSSDTSSPSPARPSLPEPSVKDRDVYKTYLRAMGLRNAVLFLLYGALFSVSFKFPDIWIQWWSNETAGPGPGRSPGYWIGIYAVLECIPLLTLALWLRHVSRNTIPAVGISIHGTLLATVMRAPFSYISNVDSGSVMNRLNQDLMFIDSVLPFSLFNTVESVYVAVIQVVFIAVASVQALAAVPAVLAVLYAVQKFYLRTSKQLRILDLEAKAVLHSLVSDVAAGAGPSTIRAHAWQGHLRASFMRHLDDSQEPIYLLFCVQRWLQLVLNLVVTGLVVLVAGVAVALRTKVNPGAVGVAFLNAATLGETLTQLVLSYTQLETSLGAIARTKMFATSTPSELDGEVNGDGGRPASPWWPSDGSVRLQNLWARYQLPGTPEDAPWSLRGVSVEIPSGQKVSVCGRTGSGKSTFLLALLRMVDIPIGTAYIGGQDHSQLPLAALRRGYFVVSQDPLEESSSLRDQIDPDGQFTDEQIRAVVADCGLQDIVDANGGLSASAAGMQLSNGEAQFLSLARVILYGSARRGGILLLDEATSSLDEDAQRRMEALIESEFPDKTVISVCHKLPWALRSDRIIVLEDGEIIHDGTPQEIVKESALFAGMAVSDSE
ncbi:ABC transporter, transmembrane domain, type 1 [Cordyceps fumosorosea ARSEF 2679]|uniref:ABC transporter, transmembrane domain, type 1 n=1 Tax=Cordyceps fumosorosea (strain ARSEF 2679) TaxID=1081104 RepID=A0A167NLK7_CORFA|nr:ABC transporter, transmembrane domain, type 1 [Cordyceps fumosorosea ARSEF 2679]OAA55691.1 ABC transporter, transmembrane domain, type 1 [Cordyceps fumosorosea ARSEF 2679]